MQNLFFFGVPHPKHNLFICWVCCWIFRMTWSYFSLFFSLSPSFHDAWPFFSQKKYYYGPFFYTIPTNNHRHATTDTTRPVIQPPPLSPLLLLQLYNNNNYYYYYFFFYYFPDYKQTILPYTLLHVRTQTNFGRVAEAKKQRKKKKGTQ